METDSTIDYFEQTIIFNSPDGPVNVTLPILDQQYLYNLQICINYGSQIGASIAILIALLLLSKPDRRLSAIMILNTCSLIFNIIRNILQCLFFTGPYGELYAQFTGDFSHVGNQQLAISVTATVFTSLLQVCVEASLYMQARVVCITLHEVHKRVVLSISAFVASIAIGLRFAYMVKNDISIMEEASSGELIPLGHAVNITTSISIIWFSAVFVTKLAFALHQRKKMGIKQFGHMQILLIMGCQTLIVPGTSQLHHTASKSNTDVVVFSILQYFAFPAASSNALTACAVFLPLSSLWASASVNSNSRGNRISISDFPLGSRSTKTGYKAKPDPLESTHTTTTIRFSGSTSQLYSPKDSSTQQVQDDLEKQGLTDTAHFISGKG
ncbi:uncharacterized protein KY384_008386 [Bacidia gigantensis]|uniref:uncharacterized protein n=1 Tax=Bacidia gigantensis TaxID=2732470 RepID=UPI001D042077|nr:uncharacterized protein KY384_008386 [Bacidia gigantensis]KAG8526957.1 hypothetical protein KY384_008386 [Bacidia gigantensis]